MDYSRMIHFIWNGAGYEMEEYRPSVGTSAVRLKRTMKAPVGAMHPSSEAQPPAAARRHHSVGRLSHERIVCPKTHDKGTRRGDASVVRSAIDRSGTPARYGSAIVTREASPEPFAQQRTIKAPVGGDASLVRSATDRSGTQAPFGWAIVTREASPEPFRISPPAKKTAPVPLPGLGGDQGEGRPRQHTQCRESRTFALAGRDRPTGRAWHLRHHHRCRAWYQSRRMFRPYECDLWNPPSPYRRTMPRRYTADTQPKTNNH